METQRIVATAEGNYRRMYDFTLSPERPPAEIAACVEKYGIAHIPAYLDGRAAAEILADFDRLFDLASRGRALPGVVPPETFKDYTSGKLIKLDRAKAGASLIPAIGRVFGSARLGAIVDAYLGRSLPGQLNHSLQVAWDTVPGVPITPIHFDPQFHLKFCVYLTDTDESNGAFRLAPGTHVMGRSFVYQNWIRRQDISEIAYDKQLEFPDEIIAPMLKVLTPIVGPAGTLFVFDSHAFHQGGVISPGKERRMIRADSGYPLGSGIDFQRPPDYSPMGAIRYGGGFVKHWLRKLLRHR